MVIEVGAVDALSHDADQYARGNALMRIAFRCQGRRGAIAYRSGVNAQRIKHIL